MKYEMTFEVKDGMNHFTSKNDGFDALYIVGLLEWKKEDILLQIRGEIKPDVVERVVITDPVDQTQRPDRALPGQLGYG